MYLKGIIKEQLTFSLKLTHGLGVPLLKEPSEKSRIPPTDKPKDR